MSDEQGRIDRKFTIEATCLEHRHRHTEHDAVLFLAKDQAFPTTLRFYRQECERLGAAPRQLLGIDLLIDRVERYQAAYPERIKVADIDETATGDAIVAPNPSAGR